MDITINIISYILIPLWIIGVYEFAKIQLNPKIFKRWWALVLLIVVTGYYTFVMPSSFAFNELLKFYIPTIVAILMGLKYSNYELKRLKELKKRKDEDDE